LEIRFERKAWMGIQPHRSVGLIELVAETPARMIRIQTKKIETTTDQRKRKMLEGKGRMSRKKKVFGRGDNLEV
jgi:hypothetical protein